MCIKGFKTIVVVTLVGLAITAFVFGTDMLSYLRSSTTSMQRAVKDAIPVDFELQRARDLLEEIIPEMHANIKLIAREEVEIAALTSDITQSEKLLQEEQQRLAKIRQKYDNHYAALNSHETSPDRRSLLQKLSQRFDRFKEAQVVLESKRRLLQSREQSLDAAMGMLEKTRSQKELLAGKIETLQSQYRLVQASSVGSKIQFDDTKLAQTEKLINQIKKRLDVAERILAHESRFVDSTPIDEISETELLEQMDQYFTPSDATAQPSIELSLAQPDNTLAPPVF